MFVEVGDAVKEAVEIFDQRRKIELLVKKIVSRIRKGHLRVPIFGLGGTGKTTLGRVLSGTLDPFSGPKGGYAESVGMEELDYKEGISCTFYVPPGQAWRQAYFWPDLYRMLGRGKSQGIINLVSYGYHSLSPEEYPSIDRHPLHRDSKSKADFLNKYLNNMRAAETENLRRMVPHLQQVPGKLWMITLVTKQDLWWDSRFQVRDHYAKGDYSNCINEMKICLGKNFLHEYSSTSILPSNFRTAKGETLAKVTAGHDAALHSENLKNFIDKFRELAAS